MNEYGLDYKYFEGVIEREFGKGLRCYKPDELARVCLRIARTASPQTLNENEFSNTIKAEAVRSILDLDYDVETPNGNDAYSATTIENHADRIERGELKPAT